MQKRKDIFLESMVVVFERRDFMGNCKCEKKCNRNICCSVCEKRYECSNVCRICVKAEKNANNQQQVIEKEK